MNCLCAERNLRFVKQNEVAGIGGNLGARRDSLAWIATPFILERAYPSKDGDAKLWAFTFWTGSENFAAVWKGRQAAEGKDR